MKRHFRCSEPTLQKSSEPNPALNRGTFPKTWREDKDVFTDHSGAKRISDKARVKELRLFYHAWHTFTIMFLASSVENVSSFPLQRCEMLTTSWAVCALYPGRQQMSEKKKRREGCKGSMVWSHRHSTLLSMWLIVSIPGKGTFGAV